jgi:hypothetical protein
LLTSLFYDAIKPPAKQYRLDFSRRKHQAIMTDSNFLGTTCATAIFRASPEIGDLVPNGSWIGVFLGFKDSFVKLVGARRDWKCHVFYVPNEVFEIREPRDAADFARLYKGCLEFSDGSESYNERLDPDIDEGMIQRARGRAYELATVAIQRIRELNDPHSVDGISASLDFMERTGADLKAIENEREKLADAREYRRVAMGYEPFDAQKFYTGLRAAGADPFVAGNEDGRVREYISAEDRTGDSGPLHIWANYEDPDRQLRIAHMRSVWEAARPARESPAQFQYVPLGV